MLSLNNELDLLIKRKISVCNCSPCDCADQKKEVFFQELKEVLDSYNREYTRYLPEHPEKFNSPYVSEPKFLH